MSLGLADSGEKALLEYYLNNRSLEMGVYNDSTDAISDSDSVSDIGTEPAGSNYGRETVETSESNVSLDGGSALSDINAQTFHVTNSTQDIDAAFFYNPADDFFLRVGINTDDYPNDYIDLAQLDNLRLGGDMLELE